MLMPGAPETDAALAANVIVRASFDSVIPGNLPFLFLFDFLLFVFPFEIYSHMKQPLYYRYMKCEQ